jgi:hypothetical protein
VNQYCALCRKCGKPLTNLITVYYINGDSYCGDCVTIAAPCARCAKLEALVERAVRALAAQDEPCAMDGWACGSEGSADCPADARICWRAYLTGKPVVGGGR